jgi:hypothetical protein
MDRLSHCAPFRDLRTTAHTSRTRCFTFWVEALCSVLLLTANTAAQDSTAPSATAESVAIPPANSPWVTGPIEQVEGIPMDGGPAA